jgi:hypothetical protein
MAGKDDPRIKTEHMKTFQHVEASCKVHDKQLFYHGTVDEEGSGAMFYSAEPPFEMKKFDGSGEMFEAHKVSVALNYDYTDCVDRPQNEMPCGNDNSKDPWDSNGGSWELRLVTRTVPVDPQMLEITNNAIERGDFG